MSAYLPVVIKSLPERRFSGGCSGFHGRSFSVPGIENEDPGEIDNRAEAGQDYTENRPEEAAFASAFSVIVDGDEYEHIGNKEDEEISPSEN